MASVFDSLGTATADHRKYLQKNINIRKYLRNHKGSVSKSHKARLVKLMKENHAKGNPTDAFTGANLVDVERSARGDARTKYGPAWQSIGDSLRGQQTALANLPTYFDRRRADLTTLASNQAAAAQAIRDRLAQEQQSIHDQTQGFRDRVAAEAQGNPLMAQANQAAQDSAASRQASSAAQGANIAAIGSLSGQTYKGLADNTQKEQAERVGVLDDKIASLKQQRDDLSKGIGEYFTGRKDQIISGMADNQVKMASVQATAASNAAKNNIAEGNLNERKRHNKAQEGISQQNADTALIRAKKTRKTAAGGYKPMTAKQNSDTVDAIKTAKEAVAMVYNSMGGGALTKQQWQAVRMSAAKQAGGTKANSLIMDAAINWMLAEKNKTKMSHDIVAKLHEIGFKFRGTVLPY